MKTMISYKILTILVLLSFIQCQKEAQTNEDLDKKYTQLDTSFIFNKSATYGTIADQEGNIYKTIKIGNQTWMAENLRTSVYNDGTLIPYVSGPEDWISQKTGAQCVYNNSEDPVFIKNYGRLYNWYAVNTNKLAPIGWHVPSNEDWNILYEFLSDNEYSQGYTYEVCGIGKSLATITGWETCIMQCSIGKDKIENNRTGFSAIAGGLRAYDNGTFKLISSHAWWWSSSTYSEVGAYWFGLKYDYSILDSYNIIKYTGLYVRCIKD